MGTQCFSSAYSSAGYVSNVVQYYARYEDTPLLLMYSSSPSHICAPFPSLSFPLYASDTTSTGINMYTLSSSTTCATATTTLLTGGVSSPSYTSDCLPVVSAYSATVGYVQYAISTTSVVRDETRNLFNTHSQHTLSTHTLNAPFPIKRTSQQPFFFIFHHTMQIPTSTSTIGKFRYVEYSDNVCSATAAGSAWYLNVGACIPYFNPSGSARGIAAYYMYVSCTGSATSTTSWYSDSACTTLATAGSAVTAGSTCTTDSFSTSTGSPLFIGTGDDLYQTSTCTTPYPTGQPSRQPSTQVSFVFNLLSLHFSLTSPHDTHSPLFFSWSYSDSKTAVHATIKTTYATTHGTTINPTQQPAE